MSASRTARILDDVATSDVASRAVLAGGVASRDVLPGEVLAGHDVLVGNDVVDLDEPEARDAHRRERFVRRVLSEGERALLAASLDPRTLLWSLFAAKEAAYKVATKLGPPRPFAHRELLVAADLRSVRVGGVALSLRVDALPGVVHAVASSSSGEALAVVAALEPSADPSAAVRALARRTLAVTLACPESELAIVRDPLEGSWDGFGPPRVERGGSPLALDVSLSHDGRFVAFAWSPFPGAPRRAAALRASSRANPSR